MDQVLKEVLLDRGPLSLSELVEALQESELDLDLGPDPEEEVFEELSESVTEEFARLSGDRWAYLPGLVRDRVFTHRLTQAEIAHDLLSVSPDLVSLITLPPDSEMLQLVGGGAVSTAYPGLPGSGSADELAARPIDQFGSVLLPAGALAGLDVAPGNLVSVTITDDGVQLTHVAEDDVRPHPDAVGERLAEIVVGGRPTELEEALLTVCADVTDAFRAPHPPLADLVVEMGLERHGDWLATAGFDFRGYWNGIRITQIAARYELSREQAAAVAGLSRLHLRLVDLMERVLDLREAGEEVDPASLAPRVARALTENPLTDTPAGEQTIDSMVDLLARPEVASALLEETTDFDDSGPEALAMMTEALEHRAARGTRPALRWLRAKAYETLGRIADAEASLNTAERLDPSWPLTLLDLARYASDRGDAPRGLALLARAEPYADDNLAELLRAFLPEPGPTMGRNEPCWCGSGRKFKQCHLYQRTPKPLAERAAWLYQKAGRYLQDGPWLHLVSSVARERALYEDPGDETALNAAIRDPIVGDAVLFEGGAFAAFVDERGPLLPADERLLAEQWLLVDRSVFDVTAVRRGVGFTARDVRTGDIAEVRDRTASRGLKPGDLICARVVPAGDTTQIFGGLEPVPLHDRDVLLDLLDQAAGPEELVAFLSRRLAPPTLVNTEHDPLVICDVVLTVSSPDALSPALDQTYRRIEDTDEPQWIFERLIDGLDRICATLRLNGSQLHVNANSDRRMDGVLATIRGLDPEAAVISDEREPVINTRDVARLAKALPSARGNAGSGLIAPEDLAPEINEALTQHMRDYEQRWLDLTVPALHGLTPREAAEDPTRREDLIRLLSSFPDDDSPMAMSPGRLRAALGLGSSA